MQAVFANPEAQVHGNKGRGKYDVYAGSSYEGIDGASRAFTDFISLEHGNGGTSGSAEGSWLAKMGGLDING